MSGLRTNSYHLVIKSQKEFDPSVVRKSLQLGIQDYLQDVGEQADVKIIVLRSGYTSPEQA